MSNLRPLSLLETMYKIQTKILTTRMSGALDSVLYDHQHGFRGGRSIQTATVPILEAIRELISIDIQSAFDTIDPKIIYDIMMKEKFPAPPSLCVP